MSFLKKLNKYKNICIQCHDNPDPDSIASAYGLYCYFKTQGIQARIIYSGSIRIKKFSIDLLVDECTIPITYVKELPKCDLLILVDCQYGNGNAAFFKADNVAVIDHHCQMKDYEKDDIVKYWFIDESFQSCSAIIWNMFNQEGLNTTDYNGLDTALAYGLYTDTASYKDLKNNEDLKMKIALKPDMDLLMYLEKSNIKIEELKGIGKALNENIFDSEYGLMIIPVNIQCDSVVLAIIADFTQQVDRVKISIAYTESIDCYYFSVRCSDTALNAADIARALSEKLGSGGGHQTKAAGRLYKESIDKIYAEKKVDSIIYDRAVAYILENIDK